MTDIFKKDLRSMTHEETVDLLISLGAPKFRGTQVFEWIGKGAENTDMMKNLPIALRKDIDENAEISGLRLTTVQKSSDGTRKYLFELTDGNTIETVFMKYSYGNSICISSQAGCRMGCRFCASTRNGLIRNLTAGEMISQIMEAEKDTGEKINHIVIMGTGEPFDNYENVSRFLKIVNDKKGKNIGMRNITVSTCGLAPLIDKFGDDFDQVNLAVSLHAPNDEIRSAMMPVNNAYPLKELISVCRRYTKKTNRRITFEYTLVNGVNDSDECAEELIELIGGMLCHVNLIPLNKVSGTGFDTVSRKRAEEFKEILEKRGIPATVRRELGSDIDAACGQLRLNR